jgi:3-oxoacyl-[acyl-carrier-protein] synthase II
LYEAGLLNHPNACASIALVTASNFGDMESAEKTLATPAEKHAPYHYATCAHASLTDVLATAFHLGGPRLAVSLSCASGASAVSTAAQLLENGRAKRVLVVAHDVISPFSWSGLCSLRTMTKDRVRPFDLHRNGTIFSEGAAALLLERLDEHESPSPAPLAFLAGWATGNNGFHLTAPAVRGAGSSFVMREALKRSGLKASEIDHINAHGTGTQPNDETETQAIQDVFGASASTIPVTSIKGTIGHLLGAAGAIEIVVSVLSLYHNLIPPTANYETPDPACDLDIVTSPRTAALSHVLSNSAGFGGCNSAVILSKQDPAKRSSPSSSPTANAPVYIKGIGAICSLGSDLQEIAIALQEGEPALAPLSRFSYPGQPIVGEVATVDLAIAGVAKKSYLDPASALFLAATAQALHQARVTTEVANQDTIGIIAGTSYGCLETVESFFADYLSKGPRLVKPLLFPHSYTNTPVSLAAMEWELRGEHDNHVSSDIASGTALLQAFDLLASGKTRTLVAGGVEALSPMRLRATGRGAAPLGEAAAAVVLSTDPCGAHARVFACSLSTSLLQAVDEVLKQSRLTPEAIGAIYVNQYACVKARTLFAQSKIVSPETLCGDVAGASSVLHQSKSSLPDLNQ